MSQKRYAYLIGANGPENIRLKYAETDVTRLAETLLAVYIGRIRHCSEPSNKPVSLSVDRS